LEQGPTDKDTGQIGGEIYNLKGANRRGTAVPNQKADQREDHVHHQMIVRIKQDLKVSVGQRSGREAEPCHPEKRRNADKFENTEPRKYL